MAMMYALATPNRQQAAEVHQRGDCGIALYQIGSADLAGIGHTLPKEVAKLSSPLSTTAWDFLSIALAVFGVDRFVSRRTSPDGWTRVMTLEIQLVEPDPWIVIADQLAETLRFLSGDIWTLRFQSGGQPPPLVKGHATDRDCICLFSGGLDSLIGSMDLMAAGRSPLLVSQAFPKEGGIQQRLATDIGLINHRFEGHTNERAHQPYEASSRTRSIVFFAYGALAASGLGGELYVPENGLISINPPLTPRRVGALSTRTTHPHFLASLQKIFDAVGLKVTIINPYEAKTKGEMLEGCQDHAIKELAKVSYSCGKGKRLNKQCGRCVPCLIRRAAFYAAGLRDETPYVAHSIANHEKYDDVQAARFAAAQLAHRNVARWAAESGPLPNDAIRRAALVDVVRRGIEELKVYLESITWP